MSLKKMKEKYFPFLLFFRLELKRSKHSERNQPHPNEYLVDLSEGEKDGNDGGQTAKDGGGHDTGVKESEHENEDHISKYLP